MFSPVTGTDDLGDGVKCLLPSTCMASGGSEGLQFSPTDDSLLLHDVPTR